MPDLTRVCVCVCLIEHSGTPHASRPPRHLRSRGLPSWTGNGQLASSRSSTPPARFGCATDAAGRTCSSRTGLFAHRRTHPSVTQSVVFDGALRVCVCVCVLAVAGPGVGDIRAADECLQSDRHDPAARSVAAAVRTMSSDARRRRCKGTSRHCSTVN